MTRNDNEHLHRRIPVDTDLAPGVVVIGLNYAPEPTGIAPYTAGLAQGLSKAGHPVRVVTAFPHYPQWRVYDGYTGSSRREVVDGIPLVRLRPVVPTTPRLVDRLLMEVLFGARSVVTWWGRPDVAVLVSPALFAAGLASFAARLRRVPSVIWVQDIYSLGLAETGRARLAGEAIRKVERMVLKSATTVVVIHDRFKRYLVEELGIPADKVKVVRNWSHLDPTPTVDRRATRAELGWGDDEIIVLHAGNMGAKQGLENVVDAAALAADRGSSVRFVLLGDGNQRADLERRSRGDHITFVDPLPDEKFTQALHSADILLVNERPGLTEMSVPSKLTSYFSSGLPVIAATDRSSVTADEMESAGAGIRVDAANPDALLVAAETLATDPDQAMRYGEAGKAYRAERLSEDAAIQAFRQVLAETVDSENVSRAQ
jgi:colanic acid biosynthesis glycosyl transferase WcaI